MHTDCGQKCRSRATAVNGLPPMPGAHSAPYGTTVAAPRARRSGYCLLATAYWPPQRPGISLIEVLFAMGVLSIGILAMAALIPLGAYEMAEVAKLDQASTLGRAAFRNLEVGGYLRPQTWVDTQWGMLVAPNPSADYDLTRNSEHGMRLLTYPYVPAGCVPYLSLQTASLTGSLPVPTSPQQWPKQLFTSFTATSGSPSLAQPLFDLTNPVTPPSLLPLLSPLTTMLILPPFSAFDPPVLVLDPLMIAANSNGTVPVSSALQTFPYQSTYNVSAPPIPRLTLLPTWPLTNLLWSGSPPVTPAQAPSWPLPWQWGNWYQPRIMSYATADRLFRSSDDLLFNDDTTNTNRDRPALIYARDNTASHNPLQAQSQGSYSWFVTIAPTTAELDSTVHELGDAATSPDLSAVLSARQFSVSVVVCQNRQLDVPSTLSDKPRPGEWMVPAKVTGGGLSGGEVALYADPANVNSAAWLGGLKPGMWIMLSGITLSAELRTPDGGSTYVYWPKFKTVANWYRIVAVDDGGGLDPAISSPPYLRNVTLHGPDWPQGVQWDDKPYTGNSPPVQFASLTMSPPSGVQFVNLTTLNSGGVYIYAYATVVEGVVGVMQKTITLDGDSPWGLP